MQKIMMGRSCTQNGRRILICKPTRRRLSGRPRRWGDNIGMYLKK